MEPAAGLGRPDSARLNECAVANRRQRHAILLFFHQLEGNCTRTGGLPHERRAFSDLVVELLVHADDERVGPNGAGVQVKKALGGGGTVRRCRRTHAVPRPALARRHRALSALRL